MRGLLYGLGWGSVIVGLLLVLLIPLLRRLIKDRETPADEAPVRLVPAK